MVLMSKKIYKAFWCYGKKIYPSISHYFNFEFIERIRKILKTIKVNENTYKILIKTSNLTGIGIGEIVQNLVRDKVNENVLKNLIDKMKKES